MGISIPLIGRRCLSSAILALLWATLLVPQPGQCKESGDEIPGSVLDHILAVPKRGQQMRDVRRQIGAPSRVITPVGNPPITRWIYPRFTVYFQRSRVLRAVRHRSNEGATFRIVERNP